MLALPCCDGDRLSGVASKFAVKWYNWELNKSENEARKSEGVKGGNGKMAENTKKTKANKEKAKGPTTYLPQGNVRRGLTKWLIVKPAEYMGFGEGAFLVYRIDLGFPNR
jgi:hypothetical protein